MRHQNLMDRVDACKARLRRVQPARISGTVTNLLGLVVEVEGLTGLAAVGDRLDLHTRDNRSIPAEVIGFRDGALQAMAYGVAGRTGARVPRASARCPACHAGCRLLLAWPGDRSAWATRSMTKGILFGGSDRRGRRAPAPPEATSRARLGPRIDLGVRALNCFATCRQGQRLGLFSGSGVGKSTLLSMLTLGTECDVVVLALVGERGREVREFIENDLGPDGMARSVVVVATSDSPPLMRRQCAYTAMTVAEHFRDQGLSVLLLMDSVTRFLPGAAGNRPVAGRAAGDARLSAQRIRRTAAPAGTGRAWVGAPRRRRRPDHRTVHRAGGGRRPQRTGGRCGPRHPGRAYRHGPQDRRGGPLSGDRRAAVVVARCRVLPGPERRRQWSGGRGAMLALQGEMADMVRLGAYRAGTDAAVDEALRLTPLIEEFLRQAKGDRTGFLRIVRAAGSGAGRRAWRVTRC